MSENNSNLDIALIILDSARRDLFGCYGNLEGLTPNIDKLAKEGLILEDHYAGGCGSTQAHVSTFLGQHSARHGVVHNMSEMNENIIAFPKVLQENGYKTYGHCMASFIPPAGYEDLFGFSEFLYPGKKTGVDDGKRTKVGLLDKVRSYPKIFNFLKNTYKTIAGQERLIKASAKHFDGSVSLKYMLDKLKKDSRESPAFVYSTLLHPHTPYYPPKWCMDHVLQGDKIDPLAFDIQSKMNAWANGDFGEVDSAIDSLKKLYKGELLYADSLVGEFVNQLKESGRLDKTIIIVTADHGELFGEDGWLNHGLTVREELYRIPCVIRYPEKIESGSKIKQLTSALDLAPTIFDLIGQYDSLNNRTKLDGVSLLRKSALSNNRTLVVDSPPVVLPERLKEYKKVLARSSCFYRAIRSSDYKYVWKSNGEEALYKVGNFEDMENNLINYENDTAKSMATEMMSFYQEIDPDYDKNKYNINMGVSAAAKMTDPKIRQELIKLGYM